MTCRSILPVADRLLYTIKRYEIEFTRCWSKTDSVDPELCQSKRGRVLHVDFQVREQLERQFSVEYKRTISHDEKYLCTNGESDLCIQLRLHGTAARIG